MSEDPKNHREDDELLDDLLDDELNEELEKELNEKTRDGLLSRRALLRILLATPFLALGIRKKCLETIGKKIEVIRSPEEIKQEKELLAKVDENGRPLYFKDEVTGNCLQRYKMEGGKVKLENGQPVDTRAWLITQNIPEKDREIVQVYKCNGEPMLNLKHKPVKLARVVAESLTEADAKLFAETGEHISLTTAFRTNLHQKQLYERLRTQRIAEGKEPGVVAKIGASRHELGFAVDVANWVDSEKWFIRTNFVGGMYGNSRRMRNKDAWHFSYDFREKYGKEGRKNYNELYRDIELYEGEPKITSISYLISEEGRNRLLRMSDFMLLGQGTESFYYGSPRIRKILDKAKKLAERIPGLGWILDL